jgi:hypothetical protein
MTRCSTVQLTIQPIPAQFSDHIALATVSDVQTPTFHIRYCSQLDLPPTLQELSHATVRRPSFHSHSTFCSKKNCRTYPPLPHPPSLHSLRNCHRHTPYVSSVPESHTTSTTGFRVQRYRQERRTGSRSGYDQEHRGAVKSGYHVWDL